MTASAQTQKKGRKTLKPPLQGKQREWVLAYLADRSHNATAAARKAGYKNPEQSGWENLHNPKVQQYIDEYYLSRHMEVNEILARLAEHARATAEPFIEFEQKPVLDGDGDTAIGDDGKPIMAYTGEFWVNLNQAREADVLHLAKEVRQTKRVLNYDDGSSETTYITSVKIVDSQAALDKLARAAGLYGPKGSEEDPIHIKPVIYIPDNGRD